MVYFDPIRAHFEAFVLLKKTKKNDIIFQERSLVSFTIKKVKRISIWNIYAFKKAQELNKKIDNSIYDDVIDYAWDIGIRNAFIQEEGSQSESFIPDFDLKSLTE